MEEVTDFSCRIREALGQHVDSLQEHLNVSVISRLSKSRNVTSLRREYSERNSWDMSDRMTT